MIPLTLAALAAAQLAPGASHAPAVAAGPWRYSETADPITDARVPSTRTLSGPGGAQFVFTCNGPERVLSFQFFPTRHLGGESGEVVLRVDDAPLIKSEWERLGRGTFIAYEPEVYRIAERLADGRRLAVRTMNYEWQPIDAVFSIEGARTQFDAVLTACGRPPLAEAAPE